MNINDYKKPSTRYKAETLDNKEHLLTIAKIEDAEFDDGIKPEIFFEENDMSLICNITNLKAIAKLHGEEMEKWSGKQIILFPTVTDFGGKTVDCIRVRIPLEQVNHAAGSEGMGDDDVPF